MTDAATDADTEPGQPEIQQLLETAARIRALLDEELDLGVDPAALFDVAPDDDRAVAIEAARLRVLLEAEARRLDADAGPPPAVPTARTGAAGRRALAADAATDAQAADASPDAAAEPLDEAWWRARLELDRARLAFYSLPPAKRAHLLERHAERQKSSAEAQAEQQLSEAELKARKAAAERERALEAIKKARSEATRLMAEERARLLGIQQRHAEIEAQLIREEKATRERSEQTLAWRRRVSGLMAPTDGQYRPDPKRADALHVELESALATVRQELREALPRLSDDASDLPTVGPNPLDGLAVEVDRSAVDELRAEVVEADGRLRAREMAARWGHAQALMQQLEGLNEHRLALLGHLSDERREAVTGFGGQGLSVARAELAQVWLVLRYHLLATGKWIVEFRSEGQHRGSAFVATITALKWVFPIAVFVWWRRRADAALDRLRHRAEEKRRSRGRRDGVSFAAKFWSFVRRVRRPIEWLLLVWAVVALLPAGASQLLEVELVWTVAQWTLGGLVIVSVIDASFAASDRSGEAARTARLRLRSLLWLGRIIVAFGLLLALTNKLVGEGTIYGWVWSSCWYAALPLGLVIVKWWRPVIFERIARLRRKGPVAEWIEARRLGWASFPAAALGGVFLIGASVLRRMRSFVGRFDATRRALAYWFRREIAKQADSGVVLALHSPLDPRKHDALSPGRPATELVPSVADKQVEEVVQRIRAPGGGVFAVVGERGSGKSTLLKRIAEQADDTTLVRCPTGGLTEFERALRTSLELDAGASAAEVRARLDKRGGDNAMLIDDAHRLLRPVIGGVDEFDQLLELARSSSDSCTWVLGMDAIIWQYFVRAREPRPLFDDVIELRPWAEEGIVSLLDSRSRAAGIEARFDELVADVRSRSDEAEREDALQRTRSNFYRLLWDYSRGNPGVALHFWRVSLRTDEQGGDVVRMFTTPDMTRLEQLPDSAVFVLRAVIQLERATLDDVIAATMLESSQVRDALRHALARGYLEVVDRHYRVHWDWFRAITRFLQRRHLLSNRGG